MNNNVRLSFLAITPFYIVSIWLNNYGLRNDLIYEDSTLNDQFLYEIFPAMMGLAEIILMILSIVFFIMWFRRAYNNLNRMEAYSDRLGLNKRERYDWRLEVKKLCDVARANDFSVAVLEESKLNSFESFQQFLNPVSEHSTDFF